MEKTKQSKFPPKEQNAIVSGFRPTQSEFIENPANINNKIPYYDESNKKAQLLTTSQTIAQKKNTGSSYKERKEFETNEELYNRNNQLRFSSLSMQLLGKSKKPIK